AAVQQGKVRSGRGQANFAEVVRQPIESASQRLLVPSDTLASLANSPYDVISFAPTLEHLWNQSGWVLQVGGEEHGALAARRFQASQNRGVCPAISRQAQVTKPWVLSASLPKDDSSTITGMIIDEKHIDHHSRVVG